jgi:hypothetical protein
MDEVKTADIAEVLLKDALAGLPVEVARKQLSQWQDHVMVVKKGNPHTFHHSLVYVSGDEVVLWKPHSIDGEMLSLSDPDLADKVRAHVEEWA